MDRLECLESFVAVVESGQFSAAAERLGLGKSVISRRVSELEEYLGALLIQRTTRRLSLTDAGRTFYPRAIQLLEDLADAEQSVSSAQHALSGRIRLAAPLSFGLMHLAPALNSFMSKHPGVILDMDFNDSQVDLIQEGVDLALRIGQLEDSTMVALPLAPIRTILCASPGYLARYGTPETPEALTGHQCLCYSNLPEPQKWHFVDRKGVAHSVRVENRMLANNGQIILEAAASGHGICISPTFIAYRTILEGRLVPILADYELPTATAYAIYPNRRFIPQRVRVLAEYFRELFGERPYWDEGLV
ncbi:MAG: LysR family transcriptional regulator [Candidatus Thiodiazotropha endolucinida]|uniref:LysR family transcriptional regulator n=1 Tax=Candidatus Thiodiazotropha taylori TaxID=2792791 RepID=A0A9E4NQG8_9GAMM|nr:LysR family transcriptional regulator [Candidatus Thiodiazotropha taylori]MCW4238922.1 LysR family transcriptional regulator [Candidatus Thiodiazotropha endolucinida]